MRTEAHRNAAFQARMLSTLVDPTLAAKNALAVASYQAYTAIFVPKQIQLRAILNGLSIPTVQFFPYEAFHGELYHISRTCSGLAAIATATILVAKWGAYPNMALVALKQIAFDLYGIVVP